MSSSLCFPHGTPRRAGVALVIVLAFVVLLTGLVVAFFSRALSERQISNSSASEAKVSLFADGAISTIVGDLKSEIVDGSNVAPTPTPVPGVPAVTIYVPKAAINAVPARVGTADAWANLVKTSTNGAPYPGAPANLTRAVNLTSDTPSLNGRFVSAKRWNSHYLLPKNPALDTDATPVAPPGAATTATFTPPKWVLVASDGTNPKTQGSTVIGRYAYAIYDEGGLLDINAAGFPYPTPYNPPTPAVPPFPQYEYKTSAAMADLSQLTDAPANPLLTNAGNPLLTYDQISAIVGRRNYVSASIDPRTGSQSPLGGTFPLFNWGSNNLANYFYFSVTDTSGFLAPSTLPQLSNTSVYDRKLITRQEMMDLMLRGIITDTGDTAKAERAKIQNALQYLTPYTRDLNQPSYAPVSRAAASNPRPPIQSSAQGGNTVGDYYSGAAQDAFSPNFLTLRAEAAFTRNDETTQSVAGEPLVKTRFPLQRLAWITYKGPSYQRSMSDADMQALVNTYGISQAYLQKGTVKAVQDNFGLTWNGTEWLYNVACRNANTGKDSAAGAIQQLGQVADLKTREPNFFELLKGSVDLAALGKGSISAAGMDTEAGVALAPLNFQFLRDISVDAAIIQLGANIIDQFDQDSYPTRILFDDGSGKQPREFRGIENLPYIYRVRTGMLRAREAVPGPAVAVVKNAGSGSTVNGCTPELQSGTDPGYPYQGKPLTDAGVGLLMGIPDIWNPHDQNSSMGLANLRPGVKAGSVRMIATSATPDNVALGTGAGYSPITVGGNVLSTGTYGRYKGSSCQLPGNNGGGAVFPTSVIPAAPYFSRTLTTSSNLVGTPMTGGNGGYINPQVISSLPYGTPPSPATSSILSFSIPGSAFFREPTVLAKPDTTRGGTGLAMTITNPDVQQLSDGNGTAVFNSSNGGITSTGYNTNPLGLPGVSPATQPYLGIYLGAFPLRWVGGRWSGSPTTSTGWIYTDSYGAVFGGPAVGITYALQYQDDSGNWVTYDEKYVNTDPSYMYVPDSMLLAPDSACFAFVDPRTSRFGAPNEDNVPTGSTSATRSASWRAPSVSTNWLDSTSCALITDRSGIESGFGSNFRGTYNSQNDWSNYTAKGWHYRNVGQGGTIFFQGGLFSQNSPYFPSDGLKFHGDTAGQGQLDPVFYTDADGVVRRAMGAWVPTGSDTTGQPLVTASTVSGGVASPLLASSTTDSVSPSESRPIILNRPFRSTAELGYVFSGNPWKNVDFSTPESGYSALLDVFCINEPDLNTGMVAGKLSPNTRQPMVLKAVLAGAYTDEENSFSPTPASPVAPLSPNDATTIANLLVTRTMTAPKAGPNTSNGPQPLANVGDLVGRWNNQQTITNNSLTPAVVSPHNIDGSKSYDGLSADIGQIAQLGSTPLAMGYALRIPRLSEAAVRALASVSNTRTWNLMIDVVAQTGRYPANAQSLQNFVVEGEQRCWAHIAIDRCTGQVIDSKLEVVKE